MSVMFSKYVFGNNVEGITPTPIPHDNEEYFLQCELGQCGMKHFVENNA